MKYITGRDREEEVWKRSVGVFDPARAVFSGWSKAEKIKKCRKEEDDKREKKENIHVLFLWTPVETVSLLYLIAEMAANLFYSRIICRGLGGTKK